METVIAAVQFVEGISAYRALWTRLMRKVVLLVGVSVAGCTVGPDYTPPTVALKPYHNEAAVENAAAAPQLDSWWLGFHDAALTRIEQRALMQNLDLAASLARVEQARAAARQAGAALLPSVDASTSLTAFNQSLESPLAAVGRHLPGYQRDTSLYDAGVGASWELDLFGGLHRGVEAATAEAEAADADQLGIRVSVAADAADAYFQVRGYQARLALTERQVQTDDSLLNLVRLRVGSGAATDRETAEAEALAAQARAALPPLRTALEAQSNRLDVLMGAQPGTYAAELSQPADLPPIPGIAPGQSPSDLLRRRPDVRAAERRLAASSAEIGAAVADYYPKVSLSGLLGFESLSAGHLFTAATFQPQVTGGLRWHLFDFGKVDAEVDGAKGANREALAHYRQSILHATEDVEDAFMNLVQSQAQSRDLTQEVNALTRARDRSEEAYKAGTIDLTDVLAADRELLHAQDDLVRTKADTDRAAVASFRALGGGW